MLFDIILLVLSVSITSVLFIPTALLFLVAVFLFTASNGLDLDPKNERYRKYGKIGPFKFGAWNHLNNPISARLVISSSNAHRGNSPMMGKVSTLDTKSTTYDIVILEATENACQVYDFLNYATAKKALKAINQTYAIPVTDLVAEKLLENKRKRSSRR